MSENYTGDMAERLRRLSWRTGFPTHQENGQRFLGPPNGWNMPVPPRGSEVYITHLPQDCFEDELYDFCAQAGRIYLIRLMVNYDNLSRGFCFVTYATPLDAQDAIHILSMMLLRPNWKVKVEISMNNCQLKLYGLSITTDEYTLAKEINDAVSDLKNVIFQKNLMDSTLSVTLVFDSHQKAAVARRHLLPIAAARWGENVKVYLWSSKKLQNKNQGNAVFSVRARPDIDQDIENNRSYYLLNNSAQNTATNACSQNPCAHRLNRFAFNQDSSYRNQDATRSSYDNCLNRNITLAFNQVNNHRSNSQSSSNADQFHSRISSNPINMPGYNGNCHDCDLVVFREEMAKSSKEIDNAFRFDGVQENPSDNRRHQESLENNFSPGYQAISRNNEPRTSMNSDLNVHEIEKHAAKCGLSSQEEGSQSISSIGLNLMNQNQGYNSMRNGFDANENRGGSGDYQYGRQGMSLGATSNDNAPYIPGSINNHQASMFDARITNGLNLELNRVTQNQIKQSVTPNSRLGATIQNRGQQPNFPERNIRFSPQDGSGCTVRSDAYRRAENNDIADTNQTNSPFSTPRSGYCRGGEFGDIDTNKEGSGSNNESVPFKTPCSGFSRRFGASNIGSPFNHEEPTNTDVGFGCGFERSDNSPSVTTPRSGFGRGFAVGRSIGSPFDLGLPMSTVKNNAAVSTPCNGLGRGFGRGDNSPFNGRDSKLAVQTNASTTTPRSGFGRGFGLGSNTGSPLDQGLPILTVQNNTAMNTPSGVFRRGFEPSGNIGSTFNEGGTRSFVDASESVITLHRGLIRKFDSCDIGSVFNEAGSNMVTRNDSSSPDEQKFSTIRENGVDATLEEQKFSTIRENGVDVNLEDETEVKHQTQKPAATFDPAVSKPKIEPDSNQELNRVSGFNVPKLGGFYVTWPGIDFAPKSPGDIKDK